MKKYPKPYFYGSTKKMPFLTHRKIHDEWPVIKRSKVKL